jgi:phosphatidylglycerophosphate synthase
VVAGLIKIGLTANAISVLGMVAGCVAGGMFAWTKTAGTYEWLAWLAAALFVQLRLLANLLDGMVAIDSGQASPVGELFNEVPDRVSDTAILVGAGYSIGGHVELGYVAACGALFTAYVRAMGKAAGATQEYCGPMVAPPQETRPPHRRTGDIRIDDERPRRLEPHRENDGREGEIAG